MIQFALFPDPFFATTPTIERYEAMYTDAADAPQHVRHLLGYETFVDYVRSVESEADGDVESLSSNTLDCMAFIRRHSSGMRSRGLEAAAAIFLGNTIIAHGRPEAHWLTYGEHFPSLVGAGPSEVRDVIDFLWASDDATYQIFRAKVEEWSRA